jgi:hypothetical protein
MKVEYYTPDQQELVAAIHAEFQFLVNDYGFAVLAKRLDPYPNPYSVLYRKPPIEILVEGTSYGTGMAIEFLAGTNASGKEQDRFSLGWLTQIRRPDLLALEFPDKRGQLLELPKLARELKEVADDVLRGDLSILPQIRDMIAKARIEGEKNEAQREFLRAEVRSQEAFRHQDYSSVVTLLGPHRHLLNASSRKRLEIAQYRLFSRD